jgi:hypothetical protein
VRLIAFLFGCVTLTVRLPAAQLPVALGSAGTFTVLAGSTVTNTGLALLALLLSLTGCSARFSRRL